jgi:hypothetical protein
MSPETIDLFGHLFYAFIALGMLLLAYKSKWGWVSRFVGELGWLWIGVEMEMSSIWSWGALFLVIECYGFWSWTRKSTPSGGEPKNAP